MRSAEGFVVLKGFLLIFSDLIFDSKMDPGKPSLAAAPDGPDTCPPLSRRAASIISFSWAASFRDSSSWLFGSLARGCRESQLSSTEKFSVSQTITEYYPAKGTTEGVPDSFCLSRRCFFLLSLRNDQ